MSFTINDDVTLTSSATIDNIRISGNSVSNTDTNDNIVLLPNGNGNIGIGTSSPSAKLHIVPDEGKYGLYIDGTAGIEYQAAFLDSFYGVYIRTNSTNASSYALTIDNDNRDKLLHVRSDGNVGIGTSSPGTKLQVNGYQTFYDTSLLPDWNHNDEDEEVNLVPSKIILGNGFCPQIRTFYPYNGYTDAIDLEFWTSGQNIPTDNMSSRLTIKAQSGNVGIGTTSPAAKLDVAGTLKHQGLTLNEGTTPNVDEVKTFGLFLTVTTSWSDTGITGNDLSSGTYILNMITYATTSPNGGGTTSGALEQYDMTYSGILSWYSGNTEDNRYNEILLHNSGRSTGSSNNVIFLRTIRVSGSVLKLQIRSSLLNGVTPDGTIPNFTFKFRRMI